MAPDAWTEEGENASLTKRGALLALSCRSDAVALLTSHTNRMGVGESGHSLSFDSSFEVRIIHKNEANGIVFMLDLSEVSHGQIPVPICELSDLPWVDQKVHCLYAFLDTVSNNLGQTDLLVLVGVEVLGAVLDAFPLVQVVAVGAEPAVDCRFVHADKTVRVLLFA